MMNEQENFDGFVNFKIAAQFALNQLPNQIF